MTTTSPRASSKPDAVPRPFRNSFLKMTRILSTFDSRPKVPATQIRDRGDVILELLRKSRVPSLEPSSITMIPYRSQ